MAIYHMQAKVVSRGSGRSAVAASAYMSCSRMYNDYDGIQHDYTRKHALIYQEVLLPPMAPPEWIDREQLWNAVEAAEKTKDSRLAREFVVALPFELDKDSNISLLQNFIQKNFVDMGMCADFAIHDTDGHNPHAHILLTVRPLNENGTWQYKTEKEYQRMLNILQIAPSEFVMIGNSLKSDIQPVLSLGGYGIHIPFEVMWKHEVVDTFTHDHLKQVKRFDELLLLF